MWIRIDQSLLESRKIKKLMRLTKEPRPVLIGCLVTLWLHCLTCRKDGVLKGYSDEDIGEVSGVIDCEIGLTAAEFTGALVDSGFLAKNEKTGAWEIANWLDHHGTLRATNRKRSYRKEKKKEAEVSSDVHGQDETSEDMSGQGVNVPPEKRGEEKRRDMKLGGKSNVVTREGPTPPPDVVLTITCIDDATHERRPWAVTADHFDQLETEYPGLDVMGRLVAMANRSESVPDAPLLASKMRAEVSRAMMSETIRGPLRGSRKKTKSDANKRAAARWTNTGGG